MQLYLVRHPEPLESQGLCYGRRDLLVGPDALAAAVASVHGHMPAHVLGQAVIFTSPLSRCRALARALAVPAEPRIAAALVEMDFGTWEGRAWSGVPRDELEDWARDLWDYRPGGGESASMMARRWESWLPQARGTGSSTVVAVTHGGLIRVALARAGHRNLQEFAPGDIPFGSVHRIDLPDHPCERVSATEPVPAPEPAP